MTAFQYLYNPGGLNNQKWALFGLMLAARVTGRPVVLPDFCVLNPGRQTETRVPIGRVLDLERLHGFAQQYGITILDGPAGGEPGGWEFFRIGAEFAATLNAQGRFRGETISADFFASIRPRILDGSLFLRIAGQIFGELAIHTTVQLRIERDWADHVRLHLGSGDLIAGAEDYNPDHDVVLGKISRSFGAALTQVFVAWDEDDLPVPKAVVVEAAARHGLTLFSKSDFISPYELKQLDLLERSMIDFELAVMTRVFVGSSRSTFANLVSFECAQRHDGAHPEHYIYNGLDDRVVRRWDRGSQSEAQLATQRLWAREPLMPGGETAGYSLTAHVAQFGDVSNADALCAGVAGDSAHWIEGFTVQREAPGPFEIEVRALLANRSWTDWSAAGTFVGTQGLGQPLLGFAARLRAGQEGRYTLSVAGCFSSEAATVRAEDGEACTGAGVLVAMQIVVQAVNQALSGLNAPHFLR